MHRDPVWCKHGRHELFLVNVDFIVILSSLTGTLSLLERGEEYTFSLPCAYARSILTVPWVELGGKVSVNCAKTGYSASITFHTKPFYGGKLHRQVFPLAGLCGVFLFFVLIVALCNIVNLLCVFLKPSWNEILKIKVLMSQLIFLFMLKTWKMHRKKSNHFCKMLLNLIPR